jgi:hypothetical protein
MALRLKRQQDEDTKTRRQRLSTFLSLSFCLVSGKGNGKDMPSLLSDTDGKTVSLFLSFSLYCRYKRQDKDKTCAKDIVLHFCLFCALLYLKTKNRIRKTEKGLTKLSAPFSLSNERRRHGKYNAATGGIEY